MSVCCYINNRADFIRLLRRGRILRGNGWRLHYTPNRLQTARLAINLSKKHVRLAVHRNRLRRQVRERFRQEWRHSLPMMDYLIRSDSVLKPGGDPCTDVRRLLDKLLENMTSQ